MRRIAERLALDGNTAVHGQDIALGKPDTDVLALALSLGTIVVTEDTDVGDLAMRHMLAAGAARPPYPQVATHFTPLVRGNILEPALKQSWSQPKR